MEIRDVIPMYYRPYGRLGIENEEDLVFLGRPLIAEMISDWVVLEKLIGKIPGMKTQFGDPKEIKEKIKILAGLERRARMKPALPGCRPHGWFKKEASVVVFIGRLPGRTVPDKFITGKISEANAKDFAAVTLNRDIGNKYNRGHPMPGGLQQPEIMNLWEFEYLVKHPKFAEAWLASAVYQEIIPKSHAVSFFSALRETAAHFRLQKKK